ncbi:hypothetical protein [Spartinivicinus poritis]|uniref:Uncharacterized protein n=1 Tax=Spartinivicinus poritis TaxID=2994640 RepID=A0ABT5UI92_9GAMM|nr:hypothetical protein [Spartinivicinus sp. A2-2]MDE1466085.1 hypothetical protein [Spartinivicinus sp. A2-2]
MKIAKLLYIGILVLSVPAVAENKTKKTSIDNCLHSPLQCVYGMITKKKE